MLNGSTEDGFSDQTDMMGALFSHRRTLKSQMIADAVHVRKRSAPITVLMMTTVLDITNEGMPTE